MRLEDKIAVVTGVGGRIGGLVALAYAREGAHVAAVDEDGDKAEAVAAQVKELGRKSLAMQVDVTDRAAVEEMVRRVVAEFGGIDILFNGTGTAHNQGFLTFKEEDFDHALAVGLKAFFLTCQAVGRQMAEQGRGGKIVNLSSIVGRLGSGEAAAWCTTRSGVDAMTRAIAQAPGVLRRQRELPRARRHGIHPLPSRGGTGRAAPAHPLRAAWASPRISSAAPFSSPAASPTSSPAKACTWTAATPPRRSPRTATGRNGRGRRTRPRGPRKDKYARP